MRKIKKESRTIKLEGSIETEVHEIGGDPTQRNDQRICQ